MSPKEIIKLFKCSLDTGTEVVRRYAKRTLLSVHNGSFSDFLQKKKHQMFHLMDMTPCCQCPITGTRPKMGKIEKWIYEQLYDDRGTVLPNHVTKIGNRVTQHCLHKYTDKPISIDELDLSALASLIRKFHVPTQQEDMALTKLVTIRNSICHLSNSNHIDTAVVSKMWKEFENAVLDLADRSDEKFVRNVIELSKKVDIDKEEIEEILQKIDNLKKSQCDNMEKLEKFVINGVKRELASFSTGIQEKQSELFEDMKHGIEQTIKCQIEASFEEQIGRIIVPVVINYVRLGDTLEDVNSNNWIPCATSPSNTYPSVVPKLTQSFGNESRKLDVAGPVSLTKSVSFVEQTCVFNNAVLKMDDTEKYTINDGTSQCEIDQSSGYATAMSIDKMTTEQKRIPDNEKKSFDISCRVTSEIIDEDSAVTILSDMKTVLWHIRKAKKNCILLDIQMSADALKDENTFRLSLRNLITKILEAGNVDINKSGTVKCEITIGSPLTNEEELKLITWTSSWNEENNTGVKDVEPSILEPINAFEHTTAGNTISKDDQKPGQRYDPLDNRTDSHDCLFNDYAEEKEVKKTSIAINQALKETLDKDPKTMVEKAEQQLIEIENIKQLNYWRLNTHESMLGTECRRKHSSCSSGTDEWSSTGSISYNEDIRPGYADSVMKFPSRYVLKDMDLFTIPSDEKKREPSRVKSKGPIFVSDSNSHDLKELVLKLVNTGMFEEISPYPHEIHFYDGCLVVLAKWPDNISNVMWEARDRKKPTVIIYEDNKRYKSEHLNIFPWERSIRPKDFLFICAEEEYVRSLETSNIFNAVSRQLDTVQHETDLSSVIWKACQNLQVERQQKRDEIQFTYYSSLKEKVKIRPASTKSSNEGISTNDTSKTLPSPDNEKQSKNRCIIS